MYNIIGYKYIIQWYTVFKSCTPKKKKSCTTFIVVATFPVL